MLWNAAKATIAKLKTVVKKILDYVVREIPGIALGNIVLAW